MRWSPRSRRSGASSSSHRCSRSAALPGISAAAQDPHRQARPPPAWPLPFGAHSYYVPAQLFPTAGGYLALFVTHDGFWRSFAAEAGIAGFETMAERVARRAEVLAAVTLALAADTAASWQSRLRRLGVPAAAVRTLPEALAAAPDAIVTAGGFKLVGSPVRIAGYHPAYRPPPGLGQHGA